MTNKLRKRILEVALRDGMGHIPSALSILDIVWVLHEKVMNPSDQFILSKGHGVMALYAVLEEQHRLDWSNKLMGHPKRDGRFILASTGSLGHGLPMAVGLAKAKKIKGETGRVFCLIGDGESNEGTTWESAMLAAHHKLDNLVVIVDQNKSSERALSTGDLEKKFEAFGFHSDTTSLGGHILNDGYDQHLISHLKTYSGKPYALIAQTIKGYGFSMMRKPEWHNKKLTQEDYDACMVESHMSEFVDKKISQ